MSRYVNVDELHSQGWVAARYKNWEPTPLNDNFRLEVEVKPFTTFTAADVQEVRHGRWIMHIDDLFPAESTMECDQCHEEQPLECDDKYCPNCGAKMVEGEKE